MDGDIEDDDMMVVIVGDDDATSEEVDGMQVTIKQEPLDESDIAPVEELLEYAVKHGEYINVKQEVDDIEYIEYDALDDDDEDYDAEYDDPIIPEKKVRKSKKIKGKKDKRPVKGRKVRKTRIFGPRPNLMKHTPVSYVQKLRDENPEFKANPSNLIKHLADIMRRLRPPKLSADVCNLVADGKTVKYVCSLCEVESESMAAGHRHYQRFHGEFYLMCYACGIEFTNSTNLYKHEKRCKARDAATVLKARGLYLGVKGRGRPFCTDNRFRPGGDLPKVKGRNYCSQCPASFAHKETLTAHELTHAGLRPYECGYCPAAYTSDVALKRHLQASHGENRFVCDHCGRGFKLKPLLVSHMNTHQPQRKFPCEHCGRRYARRTTLQLHINRKHLQLPHRHRCPVCPKRYGRMAHVRDHMKKEHGLAMITRSMFYQNLPMMSNISLQNAKVVFKQDEDMDVKPIITQIQIEKEYEEGQEYGEVGQEYGEVGQEYGEVGQEYNEVGQEYNEVGEGYGAVEEEVVYETQEVQVEYVPVKKPKRVYQLESNSKVKIKYEEIEEDDENPNSIDNFLDLIRNVKPGTKVVTVQKKPKTQYLNAPELAESCIPYQPRVKVHNNPYGH